MNNHGPSGTMISVIALLHGAVLLLRQVDIQLAGLANWVSINLILIVRLRMACILKDKWFILFIWPIFFLFLLKFLLHWVVLLEVLRAVSRNLASGRSFGQLAKGLRTISQNLANRSNFVLPDFDLLSCKTCIDIFAYSYFFRKRGLFASLRTTKPFQI